MNEQGTRRSILRAAVEARERFQKERIRAHNSIDAILRGADESALKSMRERLEQMREYALKLESAYDSFVTKLGKDDALIQGLTQVRGVSFTSAAKLVAYIDIHRAATVSKLWRFCGYGVVAGRAEKPHKGEKLHYCTRLKKYLFQIATQFLRNRSRYALVYYVLRYRYERERPDWTALRCHFAAIRKMVKTYLCHLWLYWREVEGLDTRPLYVHERMGHSFVYERDWFWSGEELQDEDLPMEVRRWSASRKDLHELDTDNGNGDGIGYNADAQQQEQQEETKRAGRYVRHAPDKKRWR